MTQDFYDLLGVTRDASQEEIRKAFRQQVREYHPDLNDDPRAPAQFTALKKAYETLGNPKERDDYDRMGHESYVSKRINGLPSPEEWEIPERGDGAFSERESGSDSGGRDRTGSGSTGTGTGSTTGNDGPVGGRDRDGTRSTASERATTAGAAGTGTGTGTGTGSSTRNRDATGRSRGASASATGAGGSGSSGGSGSGGTTTAGLDGAADSVRRRFAWLRRVSLGWPLIVLSDALYVAGLAFYLTEYAAEITSLVAALVAAATGPGSVAAVLGTEGGLPPLAGYIIVDIARGTAVGGPLLMLGMAFIPSVYFFVVRETRRTRTPWQPSYGYVLGALAPVVGLVVNATADPPGVVLELACYVVLPLLSIVSLPFSAFLRPRLRRIVRRTIRN